MKSHYHVVFALCFCFAATLLLFVQCTRTNLKNEDIPYSPCMKEPRIQSLPDSYVLEKWSLPEPVSQFYHFLDAWRKAPKPQDYSVEDARRDMMDTLSNETCLREMQRLYGALDPGSMVFHSFLETGRRELDIYPTEPSLYYRALRSVAREKFGRSPLFMLAFADGIFEIEITHVNTDTWFTGNRWEELENRDPNVCITGDVVDIIKGAWLLSKCPKDTGNTGEATTKCLLFSYQKSWTTYNDESTADNRDSRSSYGEIHHPKPGDRYLVFMELHIGHADSDGSSSYAINPMRDMQYEGGLFEIRDGKVHDSTDYFGLGTTPDINALKARLRNIISEKLTP